MNVELYSDLVRSLPPGLSQIEVARRIGLPYQSARQVIARCKYKSADGRAFSQNTKRRLMAEQCDWKRSNADLAREFGVSRERVRQMRDQLGKPFVESRGRKPRSV